MRALIRAVALIGAAACAISSSSIARETTIPNFAPDAGTGWIMDRSTGDDFLPPSSGPGPVTFDKAHPYVPNGRPEQASFRVADLSNPILQPWTIPPMRRANEEVLKGKYAFTAKSTCWPGGVPGILLYQFEPMYIAQTPDTVWLIWEYDSQVRRVHMNRKHSDNLKPAWFGESVGHYEGDTLVVDTIGLSDKAFIDNYRTPHTDQLHVVERYRVIDGGRTLEVEFTVEDAGAFTMPWSGKQRYNRAEKRPLIETICADNLGHYFAYEIPPSPVAAKPDF
jgi:hypothetical protein